MEGKTVVENDILKVITHCLIEMHKTCGVDKYGQVARFNFQPYGLFKDRADDVVEYLANHPEIASVFTYGCSFGTYQALSINDITLLRQCEDALHTNENYTQTINKPYH